MVDWVLSWVCQRCDTLNHERDVLCKSCGSQRGGGI